MQAVILAGGKGSRLGGDVPKPLVDIAGKSLIRHVINSLPDAIDEIIIIISAGHFWTAIQCDRKIKYKVQPEPLGTGDALRWAYPYIRGDFLLLGADTIFRTEAIRMIAEAEAPCLGVAPTRGNDHESPLVYEGGCVQILEKFGASNGAGISVMLYKLTPDIFAHLPEIQLSPRGEYEIQDAINMLSRDYGPGWVTLVGVGEYHHVTTGEDLERLKRTFAGVKRSAR